MYFTKIEISLYHRQSENFCLTYFSKPNRDPIEKKLYRFEEPPL